MVLRNRNTNMASEQPLKKKQKLDDSAEEEVETPDEPDFINTGGGGLSSLTALHLSLDISLDSGDKNPSSCRTSECSDSKDNDADVAVATTVAENIYNYSSSVLIEPAPSIDQDPSEGLHHCNLDEFQTALVKQCLCGVSEDLLRNPFDGYLTIMRNSRATDWLNERPHSQLLNALSNLQLLFDVYLKQNSKGVVCSKILYMCNDVLTNEFNFMEQIISLCETRNPYVNFLSVKAIASFLIIAKTNVNNESLETIFNFLTLENIDYAKMSFALEVVKRVVEWKDSDSHVLEESVMETVPNCSMVRYSDSESFDTSAVKSLMIKNLVARWQVLITRICHLIDNNTCVQAQTCIITFLELWENTISVRNNLSVIDTKPFYAHLEKFLALLNNGNLSPIIWKQLLSLFNEVLCYGSTLTLQDLLPDDTCRLGHFVIRYVKDNALLDALPFRRSEGYTVHSFVGTMPSTHPMQTNVDKTMLQKMVLLVLKSVALSIKETKSDSSDSSVGSDDTDYNQDMLVIGRSMKDVLKKLDVFLKANLDFHPETPFSKILIHLFSDQDDYLIESMVCTLDIIVGMPEGCAVFFELFNMINPACSFVEFLRVVSNESDVLLDYLVSNETCFLLYLLRFLKYIRKNWANFAGTLSFVEYCSAMDVLKGLSGAIERLVARQLFPYNIDPVLKLLKVCVNLYENS